ncbi:MAG TPA: endonuclease MutS2 [Vicinamibacterales bacterium]|nr:endonuclease MutS2 [Vicinamibacterales bacterium]
MFALRTLEFDRIVEVVTSFALTPLGAEVLAELTPHTNPTAVAAALNATTETTFYLERNPLFPLRAGTGLDESLAALHVQGHLLEPLPLRMVADFLDSVELSRNSVRQATGTFPILAAIVAHAASFKNEVAAVRHAIDPSGEVLDHASVELRNIRDQLRQKRQRLRTTLDQFVRGKETTKYLQEQVVTERNGRYVLMVRAEHRGNVPGIVHGSSASGASLFLEPSATVEINNDIVELEEREREEVRRILMELTETFRARPVDLEASTRVATELDGLQAKARFGSLVNGIAPEIAIDGRLELRGARHPLLLSAVRRRLEGAGSDLDVVPIDVVVDPPTRVLLITGPNTGGKTVAIKTAGLLSLMAQAGLHVPAAVAKLTVFCSVFADIGDEQSISASLSTFSAHITNIVSMDRQLELPTLVLLDEVGTGTDPNEGGALATAIVNHFKQRGAMVIATTHYDALKTWGTATDGVTTAAFAFDPGTFAPTYRLIYGAPGRSLAIEMAQRLGMPLPVVAAARNFLSDDQKKLAAHLARADAQARALEADRSRVQRERRANDEAAAKLQDREREVGEREERFARKLNEKLDDRVRQARRDIDQVIEQLKERSESLIKTAVSTGDTGAARGDARAAVEQIINQLKAPADAGLSPAAPATAPDRPLEIGARVAVGGLGMEGVITAIQGKNAEIDVRGKRMRSPLKDLRVLSGASKGVAQPSPVRVSVDLKSREGSLTELNVIGCTVDQAVDRVSRFLDDTMVTDVQQIRVVHGHGTGQLRRGLSAFFKGHPLVSKFYPAPPEHGGGGATIVDLKE